MLKGAMTLAEGSQQQDYKTDATLILKIFALKAMITSCVFELTLTCTLLE